MPRTRAGFERNPGLFVRREFPRPGIKLVDYDLVRSKVTGIGMSLIAVQFDAVRVRALLALRVHARAVVLVECDSSTETTIRTYWKYRNVAPGIIGHQNILIVLAYGQITRVSTK